jgi:hypothetical protein
MDGAKGARERGREREAGAGGVAGRRPAAASVWTEPAAETERPQMKMQRCDDAQFEPAMAGRVDGGGNAGGGGGGGAGA